jgi:hypothetical protein
MRRLGRAAGVAICMSLVFSLLLCAAQQTLPPRAIPGNNYAAQLAISPGLGYPFASCEIFGKSPSWLTCDASVLQLKEQRNQFCSLSDHKSGY